MKKYKDNNSSVLSRLAEVCASRLITNHSYLILGTLLSAACLSCTDDWNDHYRGDNLYVNDGSVWEAIKADADLSNFVKLAEGTGYDKNIDGSMMMTVFAPTNSHLSATEVDSLITEYNRQKNLGTEDDDNTVLKQMVQNHISMYNYSLSSSGDSVQMTMMNGKYGYMAGNTLSNGNAESAVNFLTTNKLYKNGVLFTIDGTLAYAPNVAEYLSMDGSLDSAAAFFDSYNVYTFDASQSVEGEIVDGKTTYLDSVMVQSNSMYNELGYINREDSSYTMLVPTDDQWKLLYDEYKEYFNYDNTMTKRDSMINVMTHKAIMQGAVFNMNSQPSVMDSILSTSYNKLNYEYYKYLRPYDAGGIFSNATEIQCSNGAVMKTSDWPIDKRTTFFQEIKIEAENSYYQDSIAKSKTPVSTYTVPTSNPFYGKVSGNAFVQIEPRNTAVVPLIRYTIPNVLSNIGYDIYAVVVPAIAYDTLATDEDRLPVRLNFTLKYNNQDGSKSNDIKMVSESNTYVFDTTPDVVDTVLVASNYQIPTCSYNTNSPQVTLQIESVRASTSSYTRIMRLDCIILRPHEEQ